MKILNNSSAIEKNFGILISHYQSVSLAVAWASFDFPAYDQLIANQKKIKRVIVGTHFYQTHPGFIAHFLVDKRVRFMKHTGGIFHPKIYLFENSATEWACIIGSANFTDAAFSRNQEVCVSFDSDDDANGAIWREINGLFATYWADAKHFKKSELLSYRVLWRKYKTRLKSAAGDFGSGKPGTPILQTPLVNLSWGKFFKKVQQDRLHSLEGRIEVLSKARDLFRKNSRFAKMSQEERKSIAGFSSDRIVNWGWFGSMWPAGTFKKRVNQNDPNLSRALDAIPPLGEVQREHYSNFVEWYVQAFQGRGGHGLATATRLLAMKRPDYFVCFDSRNKKGLSGAFGISLTNHDYEKYWDGVISRIMQSRWWNSPRPKNGLQIEVWDGRAAFLDSIFYKE